MSSRCPDEAGSEGPVRRGGVTRGKERAWLTAPVVALALTWAVTASHARAPGAAAIAPAGAASSPLAARAFASPAPALLRVCADPNNLPFSNRAGEGLENRLAQLLGRDLGKQVRYTWWPQRRGWLRHTINAGVCDVALGVPAGFDPLLTTRPYYRSRYVFVSRADRHYGLRTLDDPRLRRLRIGLHFIGDDYSNPPPAHALGLRGISRNVIGFSIYGDYREPNPPARLIDAVARDSVDVAIAWGPLAGYFARRESVALAVAPIEPAVDRTGIGLSFAIAVGVRRGDRALRDTLQAAMDRRAADIDRLLDAFAVPRPGRE